MPLRFPSARCPSRLLRIARAVRRSTQPRYRNLIAWIRVEQLRHGCAIEKQLTLCGSRLHNGCKEAFKPRGQCLLLVTGSHLAREKLTRSERFTCASFRIRAGSLLAKGPL